MSIRYTITATDPNAHFYQVELEFYTVENTVDLKLPAWIPGSYMIRDFAKNIATICADGNGTPISLKKIDKHSWQLNLPINQISTRINVTYQVYAWDLSVRTAHLDSSHGFFNGASMFLAVAGRDNEAIELIIQPPHCASNWEVATGLTRQFSWTGNQLPQLKDDGLAFSAASYDELIDCPVEMGKLSYANFQAGGVTHHIAITGAWPDVDLQRLCRDLQPVCDYQIRLFEPDTNKAPFSEYWFLIHASDNGYGGLEHCNSTALLCNRKDLPYFGMADGNADYRSFLGLCSHEYFHAWHVKRIKPFAFTELNLYQENYTSLLWVFEGFTSYYDDLALIRSKAISIEQYFDSLSKTISKVLAVPGHLVQSIAESSFDAWTKYYRQDENAINSIASYYTKGALVALCLDVYLRKLSTNKKSLDDAMRALWNQYGKTAKGLREDELSKVVKQSTGIDLSHEIERFAHTTERLPLREVFEWIGHTLTPVTPALAVESGATMRKDSADLTIKTVRNESAAHCAGLSAGDVLVAIDDYKATGAHWKRVQERKKGGQTSKILVFRNEKLLEVMLTWQCSTPTEWTVQVKNDSNKQPVIQAPWFSFLV